ncbi:DUF3322 domain-containing protein [Comamonadaceae bacterium G21597-S1]|nr:DUF3322 domain-containing protein [Comamonadaceae bacterium G21597-S1]
MNWSDPAQLRAQLLRSWERGDLLREALGGPSRFPMRLVLKGPASADITSRFDAVRNWAAALTAQAHLRLVWQELRHRVQGSQRLPAEAWVDTVDDALAWLGKRREWARFCAVVTLTRQHQPRLRVWLEKRPLQALELADAWPRLLSVVAWFVAHPRPGIYLRQVDLPGISTKFIEAHRGVLSELLDLALPPIAIDPSCTGVTQFANRYGLRDRPARIRLRVLDPLVTTLPGIDCPDLTLDAASFSCLRLELQRVFITENEINFLAFPPMPRSAVIFGAGYGWDALAGARWLEACQLHYWGDIDTHGFAILNQLRSRFGKVQSFLMDRATLMAHEALWGNEDKPTLSELPRLSPDERALYDELRDNRIRKGLRLEQELVGYEWLCNALMHLGSPSQPAGVPTPVRQGLGAT